MIEIVWCPLKLAVYGYPCPLQSYCITLHSYLPEEVICWFAEIASPLQHRPAAPIWPSIIGCPKKSPNFGILDTPLDHIWRAQICIFGIFGHIWHIWARIWARQIWSSGVSLKRSCKMQFRRVGLRSIGPSSQKLWPNQIFGRFPHCYYNVKLKMACTIAFMGL